MTTHQGRITVRVEEAGGVTISNRFEDLTLTDLEVFDLIDCLAEAGHAEYMIKTGQEAMAAGTNEENNPWIACYKSLADNNK